MRTTTNIMVYLEQNDGIIADVSLELICKATELAEDTGGDVQAVVLGLGLTDALERPGHYGCDTLYYIEDERLHHFTSVPYAKLVARKIEKLAPQIVLFGATTQGRDIAPRVASTLRCGLTADCTDLQIGSHKYKKKVYDKTLLQIRPAFGGNIVATIVSPESSPSMATVREGVMKMNPPDPARKARIVREACALPPEDFPTRVVDIIRTIKDVDLKSARIIVSAGMGAATPEGISLVKELAATIGAEVGASRPVVDAGLMPGDHQVGQTGTTVRPNLYIACGISGQIQHRAGMSESMRIIAINSDPDAPIFEIAHYGIVGDVMKVIPEMIKAYKSGGGV
ncbi:MAG: electron transfer flavoprotein subunit alpha/FixB family protein [Desulfobacterales bacterium]|nr:electron transfer flavoprotein subunit alpha/FixB family protein [Desulfobacterales bacterium]